MGFLKISNLVKKYDSVLAVNDVSFEAERGEFLTLLGPSGCGKTTILRCIAGLEQPDRGEISIGGKAMVSSESRIFVEPDQRGLGMVFQSYAIWPHLTVFQNVAYPLAERGLPKSEIKEKVRHILAMVKLLEEEDRSATKLSGGQQQRVALARALVYNPEVLLFDEPLSNLDAKLRVDMRNEIRTLQKELRITSIYVTHDQEEAFALSDRIIVMNKGKIEQIGDQPALYFRPRTRFVAEFIGETNTFEGEVMQTSSNSVQIKAFDIVLDLPASNEFAVGDRVLLVVRPEHLKVNPGVKPEIVLQGKVDQRQYLGSFCKYYVLVQGQGLAAELRGITSQDITALPAEGDTVSLGLNAADLVCFKINP